MKTILAVIGAIALLLVLGLFAICNDDEGDPDSFGPIQLVSHDYGGGYGECDPSWDDCGGSDYSQDYSGRDRNRNRGRNRGAFSPGPFDDSPVDAFNGNVVCLPGSTCYSDDRQDQGPPPEEGR